MDLTLRVDRMSANSQSSHCLSLVFWLPPRHSARADCCSTLGSRGTHDGITQRRRRGRRSYTRAQSTAVEALIGPKRSRAEKQSNSHAAVMWAVQRELILSGYLVGPGRLNFHWSDIAGIYARLGQSEVHFVSRTADVVEAGTIADIAYEWQVGSIAELRLRARSATRSPLGLEVWLHTFADEVKVRIRNARYAGTKKVQLGARLDGAPYELVVERMDRFMSAATPDHAQLLLEALLEIEPKLMASGYYGPREAGATGHFVALLSERGYGAEVIADILGRAKTRDAFRSDDAYERHRHSTLKSISEFVRETKPRTFSTLGSITMRADVAQNRPRRMRWGVLRSVGAEQRT
ncbi:MAG TPA: hypothetical protein VI299_11200 [Polyangiales bacterium]